MALLLTGHVVAVGSVAADAVPREGLRTCSAPPNPVNHFADVPNDSLFCVDIAWMAEAGITGGRVDGTYGPGDPVRRGHMAAFLYRSAGRPAVSPNAPTFTDVGSGHVFAREISWLAQKQISLGRGDGTFLPNDLLTRGQMSAFLYRFAGEPTVIQEGLQFPDVLADHRFADAVAWMASTGVTTGLADGSFGVDQPLNRGQMSAFLYRYDQFLSAETPAPDPQVPGEWMLDDRDLQVTLVWSGGEQLTLRVTDPSGEQIHSDNPTSSSGGVMDRADTPSCDAVDEIHGQNVSWPAGKAPSGTYRAEVAIVRECRYEGWFRLEVRRHGVLIDTISAPTDLDRGEFVGSTIVFTLETAEPTPEPEPTPDPEPKPDPTPDPEPDGEEAGSEPQDEDALSCDVAVPVLDAVSRMSATDLSPGDLLLVSFTARDEGSGVDRVLFNFTSPLGSNEVVVVGEPELATGQLSWQVTAGWPLGEWQLSHIEVFDKAQPRQNASVYWRNGSVTKHPPNATGPTSHTLDFSTIDFNVQ